SFDIDHLAFAIDAQRASRRTWFRQVHEDFIDRHCLLLVGRIPSRRNRAAENNHGRQKSCANPPANRHFSRSSISLPSLYTPARRLNSMSCKLLSLPCSPP